MRRHPVPDLVLSRTGGESPASLVKRGTSVAAHFAMDAKNRVTMRLFGVRRPTPHSMALQLGSGPSLNLQVIHDK